MSIFEKYAQYYTLFYEEKSYGEESAFVLNALGGPAVLDSVLEFGCGGGDHAWHLANAGVDVTAMDISQAMLERFRERAATLKPGRGSMRCFHGDCRSSRDSGVYDAVVSLFHVMSYQTGQQDIADCLANAARHLGPEGRFFFDCWHAPAVEHLRPVERTRTAGSGAVRVERTAVPEINEETRVVKVRYDFVVSESAPDAESVTHCFSEVHPMRYFFPGEIRELARQAGFSVERCAAWLTEDAPTNEDWSVYYILKKS